jgi:osmoprotectant transport system permease protein
LRPAAILLAAGLLLATPTSRARASAPVVVGSKKFTESYVLGEIARLTLERAGIPAEHRQGMGGTVILWQALRGGAIGLYPEYTGTLEEEILRTPAGTAPGALAAALARQGAGMTAPLGFDNTYALVMRRAEARRLGISRISDLKSHSGLAVGLTHEFLTRRDGWEPLAARYGLSMRDVRGVDHALGYQALVRGSLAVKDAYSTDAKLLQDDLVALTDDLHFFPRYEAVFLYRLDLDPRAVAVLSSLEGTIDEARMIRMNAEAETTKNYSRAASLYFGSSAVGGAGGAEPLARKIARWTARHLQLVGISLLFAVLLGVPLGILAARPGPAGPVILGAAGVIQTIPALALLALLVPVPFLGIRPATAIVALFLYSLLPIVRNTAAGLQDIPVPLRESAEALGLPPSVRLFRVFLPIASRTILAGIKTSAVIDVGAATLAALIGAGGLGEPILSGLNLNDKATILQGAVPAAALALLVQAGFGLLDRLLIPKGLRPSRRSL